MQHQAYLADWLKKELNSLRYSGDKIYFCLVEVCGDENDTASAVAPYTPAPMQDFWTADSQHHCLICHHVKPRTTMLAPHMTRLPRHLQHCMSQFTGSRTTCAQFTASKQQQWSDNYSYWNQQPTLPLWTGKTVFWLQPSKMLKK